MQARIDKTLQDTNIFDIKDSKKWNNLNILNTNFLKTYPYEKKSPGTTAKILKTDLRLNNKNNEEKL